MQSFVALVVSLLCLALGSRDKLAAAGHHTLLDVDNIPISVIEDDAGGPSGRRIDRSTDIHTFFIMHDLFGSCTDYWFGSTIWAIRLHKKTTTSNMCRPQLSSLTYAEAVENVQNSWGDWAADHILYRYNRGQLNLDKTTLIGYGIGAHLVGIAAKKVFKKTGKKVGRIIATSPMGAFFHPPVKEENRLHKDDAKCVIAIHTDQMFLGYKFPIGGIDFYVDGGLAQPGCKFGHLPCSHYRATEVLEQALKHSSKSLARFKDSPDGRKMFLKTIGGDCSARNGIYNLTTTGQFPFFF